MSIIILVEACRDSAGNKVHACTDARVECSPRDGFDNGKLLKFENDLRDFVNKGLADAKVKGGAK
jgi:hypothetical protein